MDITKALLVKSLRELLTITACLSQKTNANQRYPKSRGRKDCILPYVTLSYLTLLVKNNDVYSDLTK